MILSNYFIPLLALFCYYSMKENSKYKKETLQLQTLPSLAMLSKDKRYRYRDSSKEKVLRGDIDSFIHDMVGK